MKRKLNAQELRNILYAGPWVEDAKDYFCKENCFAFLIGGIYMFGEVEEQDYLETALTWIADAQGITVEQYMELHQYDANSRPLQRYYESVIIWTDTTFPTYRKLLMKGQPWGLYYNAYKDYNYDPDDLERELSRLITQPHRFNLRMIYEYLLIHKAIIGS